MASIIASIFFKFFSASRIWAGVTCMQADEITYVLQYIQDKNCIYKKSLQMQAMLNFKVHKTKTGR